MRRILLICFMACVVNAQNQNQSAQKAFTLAVVSPVAITTASLTAAFVGKPYSMTLQASGGTVPYTWSIASGTLPPGLSLTPSTGALTGTPTGTCSANPCPITIQVTDSSGTLASIQLQWTPSTGTGVTAYNLYRGTTSGGPYAKIGSVKNSPYVDILPRGNNTKAYYVARAQAAKESVNSNEVLAVIP